jgi:hypothetical protein
MKSTKLQVFDPPMCCSTGVCGPNVNPELARFSSDLDWLKKQGMEAERFNLASHPAEFARHDVVKETLHYEGTQCLPLILVNGSIVSRAVYPTREELMQFIGIDSATTGAEGTQADTSSINNEASTCGPGCNCAAPSGNTKVKTLISVIILLALGGILLYKEFITKPDTANTSAAKGEASFVAQAAQSSAPKSEVQSSGATELKQIEKTPDSEKLPRAESAAASNPVPGNESQSVSSAQPEKLKKPTESLKPKPTEKSATTNSAEGRPKIGELLESLNMLNKVALSQDAVFIFVPTKTDEPASEKTNSAVLAAQRTLTSKGIKLGLYTLQASSPDYSAISNQVQLPAILVASKGKGMGAVSGEVTATKLVQAFVASSRSGGCCPSGSRAPSSDCK